MKNTTSNPSFSLLGVLCSLIGHHYVTTNKITEHISEYQCTHCGKEVTNGISGDLEPLNFKNKEVNACLASFFKKKNHRISIQ